MILNNLLNERMLTACRLLFLVGIVALCGCTKDPEVTDPEASLPSISSQFDAILAEADEKWEFFFTEGDNVVRCDIAGRINHVVIPQTLPLFNNRRMESALSPNGHCAILFCGGEYTTQTRVAIIDLIDAQITQVNTMIEGYNVAWPNEYSLFWLNDSTFLVQVERYAERADGYYYQITEFIRYDVNSPKHPTFEGNTIKDPIVAISENGDGLLIASESDVVYDWAIEVLEYAGIREGTPDERSYFNSTYRSTFPDRLHPSLSIESVSDPTIVEDGGRFWKENLGRHYLKLDNRVVRCTVEGPSYDITWDDDLKLFIWSEGDNVYVMDQDGHYRFWRTGTYMGKRIKADKKES